MRADLHIHSVYSDGRQTPADIAKTAKKNGVQLLSVTDHDTMAGGEEKRAAALAEGLLYVPGWEISAYEKGKKVHITGYHCDDTLPVYAAFMKERTEGSYRRAEDILQKLAAGGIVLTMEEVLAFHPVASSPLHTMHIARAVAAKGYYKDEFAVYETCLKRGAFAYSDLCRPTPFEAVDVIHALGGIASLAHPGRLGMEDTEKEKLLIGLKERGLDGIEAVYTTHTERETRYFKSLAARYSLLVTGGSDTHIEGFGGRSIGFPVFEPSDELLSALFPALS